LKDREIKLNFKIQRVIKNMIKVEGIVNFLFAF